MSDRDRFADLSYRLLRNDELVRQDQQFWIEYLLKFLKGKDIIQSYDLGDVLDWKFTGDNVIFTTEVLTLQPGILSIDYGLEDLLLPIDSITTGPGGNRQIDCVKVSGTTLYVGGDFTAINGVTANGIAQLNLTTGIWSAMGSGLADAGGGVLCIDVDSNGNVYAGGQFTGTYDGLAVWNGSSWSNLGVNADVEDMYIKNDVVYICGDFSSVNSGATAADRCAKYDIGTTTWTALDTGITGTLKTVFAIYVDSNNYVYIGGQFSAPQSRIMVWKGASWLEMDGGLDNTVTTITGDSNDVIYVGGSFHNVVGGIATTHFVKWNSNTSQWESVSGGTDDVVYELEPGLNDEIYIGGTFETSPGYNIGKWSGGYNALLDALVNDGSSATNVTGLSFDSSATLYICGYLRNAANTLYWYIKKYNAPSTTYSQDILGYSAEDENFKSTDDQMSADSDVLYPSQSAVRDYAPKKNVTTSDPTVNDDVTLDYRAGDIWINTNG